jgi:hypothetical protein
MIHEREFRGYWWLPENPENKVGGIAKFTPNSGVTLNLFSVLNQDQEYLNRGNVFRSNFIQGISLDGNKITLKDCIRTNYTLSSSDSSGIATSNYQAISLLEGAHFSEQIKFNRFRVEFPLLAEWAGITGIGYSPPETDGDTLSAGDSFEVGYTIPESVEAELDDIFIRVVTNTDVNLQRVGGAKIDEATLIEIEPVSDNEYYSEYMDIMRSLQDFLTLGTGKNIHPSSLIGRIDRPESPGYTDINVMYSTAEGSDTADNLHPLRANFVLGDIDDRFEDVISNWFNGYETLGPVYNLYFSTKYNREMYVQNEFLSLIQAIETYHRREFGGQYLPEEEFEEVYETLCASIPEEVEESFRSHLVHGTFRYANEYSLRKRLSELVLEHNGVLSELPANIESSINKIVNTRNYYIHYDENIEPRVEQEELPKMVNKLGALIETVFLSRINIPEDQIIERLSRRYQDRG